MTTEVDKNKYREWSDEVRNVMMGEIMVGVGM